MIHPYQEPVDVINLGTEEDREEVKVGVALEQSVKEELVKLLQEYMDVFSWSCQDMTGLDTDMVVHNLPLKSKYPPIKHKLRRTRPDMDAKIREEVKKQFNVGFLVVETYPQWITNIVPIITKDGKV